MRLLFRDATANRLVGCEITDAYIDNVVNVYDTRTHGIIDVPRFRAVAVFKNNANAYRKPMIHVVGELDDMERLVSKITMEGCLDITHFGGRVFVNPDERELERLKSYIDTYGE